MNLRNLGRNHEPTNFEEFVVGDFLILNDSLRVRRIAESAVGVGLLLAELVHEPVVFTGEYVMEETQADRPIIREGCRFLVVPCVIDRIDLLEQRQITRRIAGWHRIEAQLGPVMWVAFHALARGLVVTIELRRVPPCRDIVASRFIGP